jgi:predicted ATPase/DNA-binding SARP family transcriptional activator
MLNIVLFGEFEIRQDGKPVELSSRPAQTLLAYLLLNRETAHRRERLAGILWPDVMESSARQSLRNALWHLRRAIGEAYLLADKTSLAFNTAAPYTLDVAVLEREPIPEDLDDLIQVLSLYKGDLLPGFYEDWILLERERLRAVFERRMQSLLESLAEANRWPDLLVWAERWIAMGHVPEPAFRALMTAHAGLGDLARVATSYRRCVQALEDELGVPPSTETQDLYQRLSRGETACVEPAGPVRRKSSPGGHRPAAAISWEVLPSQATSFVGREEELAEIDRMLHEEMDCRLLTLVGPGGIGKTRLAVEAAHAASFPDGACFIPPPPLSSSLSLVYAIAEGLRLRLYESLDAREQLFTYLQERQLLLVLDNFEHLLAPSYIPPSGAERGGVGRFEAEKEKRDEGTVTLVAQLLERAPHLKILVTSRERLNLSAEWVLNIHGLQVPPPPTAEAWKRLTPGRRGRAPAVQAEAFSAVQLFLQRARQVKRGIGERADELECVAHICRLVHGMPLAIELAAAWVIALTCNEILHEIERGLDFLATTLRDFPERHRSVRAVFDSSWAMLSESERRLFRRLSVFHRGLTRAAAEAVGGESPWSESDLYLGGGGELQFPHRQPEVLEALAGLVNKSFLRHLPSGRYEIHELLRHYGAEKLAEDPEDERGTNDRHAQYYLTFLGRQEVRMKGPEQRLAHASVAPESENISAGWLWAARRGRTDLLIRSFEALWLTMAERGLVPAAHHLINQTMAILEDPLAPGEAEVPEGRLALGIMWIFWGGVLMRLGDFVGAASKLDQGIVLLRPLDPPRWAALGLNWKAANCMLLGTNEEARQCLRESIEQSRRAGDQWLTAYSLNDLGMATHLGGDTPAAQHLSRESLDILIGLGDRRGMAFAYNNLGTFAVGLGDYPEAERLYRESLALRRENGDQWGAAYTLTHLGAVSRALGDHHAARPYLLEAISMAWEVQAPPIVLDALVELAALLLEEGDPDLAREILQVSLGHPALTKPAREKAEHLLAELPGGATSRRAAPPAAESPAAALSALVSNLTGQRREDYNGPLPT